MPGKHVRFSSHKFVKLFTPPTPSPCYSQSTLPSEDSPITPPSMLAPLPGPKYSKYGYQKPSTSLPPPAPRPIRINPLLALAYPSQINYDLTRHPVSLTHTARQHPPSARALSESAVTPPMPYLTLVTPLLPWRVSVTPQRNGVYVTVYDVLSCLYTSLRTNVAGSEYHALQSDTERRRVGASYEARYRRIRDAREYRYEKTQGLKRVDFLMGRVRFEGLSKSSQGPDVWVINVS